ncbi:MAG: family 43 glycosylhydrolase, partial [Bacteroidota bacterium]
LKDGNGGGTVYFTDTLDDPDSWKPVQGKSQKRPDSQFFLDDDGRLWNVYGCNNSGYLHIQELNTETFEIFGKTYSFNMPDIKNRGWERANNSSRGNNDRESHNWVEGGQMLKHKGKYYFVYSLPDLSNAYANGVYTADNITGPYTYQQDNPASQKLTGFSTGAAHGEIFKDKYGNWWTFTCQSVWRYDRFERRIGMFPTFFDENGSIHSDTYLGDYPTMVPQQTITKYEHQWTGMNLLSYNKSVLASSSLKGREPLFGVDEKIDTWWSAKTGNEGEWFMIDLFESHTIEGIQVNFSEQDLTVLTDRDACMKYYIEGSVDSKKWDLLIDKRKSTRDTPHEFSLISSTKPYRYIKITNVHMPHGGKFALRGLRVFGHGEGKTPAVPSYTVKRNEKDPREALLTWEEVREADGYIIRYGLSQDKLNHSNIVYHENNYLVRSLDRGTDYYFTIDAYNENGVTSSSNIQYVPSTQKNEELKVIEAEILDDPYLLQLKRRKKPK